MFNCQMCGKTSNYNEKVNFVVIKKRTKVYNPRGYANKVRDEEGKWKYMPDNGGEGYETVKEARCCPDCAEQYAHVANEN